MAGIWDSSLKKGYYYNINDAKINLGENTLFMDVSLNFVIPNIEVERGKYQLMEADSRIKKVDIKFNYENMVQREEEFIPLFLEHEIEKIKGKWGHLLRTLIIENNQYEGDTIKLNIVGEAIADKLNDEISAIIEKNIENNFRITRKLIFVNCAERYEKVSTKIRKLHEDGKKNGISPDEYKQALGSGQSSGSAKLKEPATDDDMIIGRNFKGDSISLAELKLSDKPVILEGRIFSISEKKLPEREKNNVKRPPLSIMTMLITDETSSVCVNFFVNSEVWAKLSGSLKENTYVIVRGPVENNKFTGGLVLIAKSIKLGKKPVTRIDRAEQKRVELHAHTKMSSMDSVNEPKDFISLASGWGHKAVAITDHGVVMAFPKAAEAEKKTGIKVIYGLEGYLLDDDGLVDAEGNIDYKGRNTNHIILLAKNQEGLKNLYRLVSYSHLYYHYKKPRIPKSVLLKYREGLIIGSACEAGQVFRQILLEFEEIRDRGSLSEETHAKTLEIAKMYDYLEIMPLINNDYLTRDQIGKDGKVSKPKRVNSYEDLKTLNKMIVALGEEINRPVVATCDVHYINEQDSIYRAILLSSMKWSDLGRGGLYFRTTDEMLEEFSYLGEEKAKEVVIDNSNLIADRIGEVSPIAKGKFPPKIENADEKLRSACYERAESIYGKPLPREIAERLQAELSAIIDEGYAVMYVSARMVVEKSEEAGYIVGSRGSVGSSFAATMAQITEVNPLKPHYICPNCKHLIWGNEEEYDCGVDMEAKDCPKCGTPMKQDGFTIPFETFLGIPGKIKEPDIDLNFAGEYQAQAHKYVETIFGANNVFKAGTIGTLKDKTAAAYTREYCERWGIPMTDYDQIRISKNLEGVRKSTGQHPGGVVILPEGHEIFEFTPVQRPANKTDIDVITTHFDYHAIDQNLLKLDILGHEIPTMLKHLHDMTGLDPMTILLKDDKVASLFKGTEALDIKHDNYKFVHGSFGIPEFGTDFVRRMLDDTNPEKFGDLVRISGFSHGTDVWTNNAQDYIISGMATMNNVISTRDDIMNYLIMKGVPSIPAFTIMEKVRKGKGVTEEEEALMKENDVPQWYIDSCRKIKYMFPRAHAVAYVIMSYRIAYYKVYYPAEFYAATFSSKLEDFNWVLAKNGIESVESRLKILEQKNDKTAKEKAEKIVIELIYEMMARGIEFMPPSLEHSKASQFYVKGDKVVVPIQAISGIGTGNANDIIAASKEGHFSSVEDFRKRTKTNNSSIEVLRQEGVLAGLPESDQFSLF